MLCTRLIHYQILKRGLYETIPRLHANLCSKRSSIAQLIRPLRWCCRCFNSQLRSIDVWKRTKIDDCAALWDCEKALCCAFTTAMNVEARGCSAPQCRSPSDLILPAQIYDYLHAVYMKLTVNPSHVSCSSPPLLVILVFSPSIKMCMLDSVCQFEIQGLNMLCCGSPCGESERNPTSVCVYVFFCATECIS